MVSFIGEYKYSIDQKGRLAVPAKFRKDLSGGAVLTRGLDNCLFLFTQQEWEILMKKIVALPLSQANSRAFSRLMLAGAMELTLDSQGRILIPDYLRKYASLSKKTVMTGLFNRLEIWDENAWQSYQLKTEKESTDIAEKLSDLGI
ncbi:MAG: division/cell wall cluster transcriptional repressor MraZ [Candidatus Parcubacteria bacterium]|nr:division/cell wall cluster transcriptional repressor MraZ [Candidatus Parcubacteria bacterium]